MHISYEQSKQIKYKDLFSLVREHGEITIEASVINYNPAFGLVNLDIHPDDRDKIFGDDDESTTNFHNVVYRGLTKSGTKRVTKDNNRFVFTISDKGDFGPNTNGLGIMSVNKKRTNTFINNNSNSSDNADVKNVLVFFIAVALVSIAILSFKII